MIISKNNPTWFDLLSFIKLKDPSFLNTVKGVPLADIEECEESYSITLPKIYKDFLVTMGADSGELYPFEKNRIARFYENMDDLSTEAENYPEIRFFKIAENFSTSGISSCALYIDLARSDGNDAPLIESEDYFMYNFNEEYSSEDYIIQQKLTLVQQLASRIFIFFEFR